MENFCFAKILPSSFAKQRKPTHGEFLHCKKSPKLNAALRRLAVDGKCSMRYAKGMLRAVAILCCLMAVLAACVSRQGNDTRPGAPEPPAVDMSKITAKDIIAAAAATTEQKAEALAQAPTVVFDPQNPPPELYIATKVDIQDFVRKLDTLIRAKNYPEWIKLLSKDYLEHISSETFLRSMSQQPRLKSQKIVLQSNRDYFIQVVVPSRANDRADDIEFVTLTRVKVYTVNDKGQKLRLYTLDKTPESWEIGN
jgi:hypothetical protein